jgi:transcriptional regulator with XRE-family HTH domain
MPNPHPIDVHIGKRLRQRRSLLGMSQSGLGAAMGVSFQQVQKYERGANRIGATQLFEVSRVLDIPISFFFEDAGALSFGSRERKRESPTNDRETLHLVRDFFRIRDRQVRLSVARMVKAIAQPAPLGGRTLGRQDTVQPWRTRLGDAPHRRALAEVAVEQAVADPDQDFPLP